MIFKNSKVYDTLKWICLIVLPASATFYSLLASTWGLPYAEQIPTTITGFATFLGVCLCISNSVYTNKHGEILGEAQQRIAELDDDYVGEKFFAEDGDEDE